MVMGSIPEEADIAVIGGGVGGYVAAIRAAELGKSVTIVEKDKLGGHCLNYACIPSKTIIHIADLFYSATHSQNLGISGSLSIDAKRMHEWRISVSQTLEKGVEGLCRANGIEIVKGEATFLNSNTLQLTNGTSLDFKKAIIATGSVPSSLKGFEFNGRNIIDYKQALSLDYIPKSIAIIGAGYVSVEIAGMFAKLGSSVHVIARSDVLSRFDPEAVALVKKRLANLGAVVHLNAAPSSYDGKVLRLSSGEEIPAEVVVVAIGLVPYTDGLELHNTKVAVDGRGFVSVDSSLQTADQNILAIGDVVGEPMLAHKAIRQGVIAAEKASGLNSGFDNIVIPAVIFSDPEIAIAGSLDAKNVKKFPMSAVGRGIALDRKEGFVKMAYDDDNIVRGIEIVGQDANAMIAEAALAIEMGATLEDIADTIHPHPTFSEAVQEAAEAALGRPLHFYYGKGSR